MYYTKTWASYHIKELYYEHKAVVIVIACSSSCIHWQFTSLGSYALGLES